MTERYLVIVEGDVDPSLRGPYSTEERRDRAALRHRRQDPEMRDGIFKLNIRTGRRPQFSTYSGGFFNE